MTNRRFHWYSPTAESILPALYEREKLWKRIDVFPGLKPSRMVTNWSAATSLKSPVRPAASVFQSRQSSRRRSRNAAGDRWPTGSCSGSSLPGLAACLHNGPDARADGAAIAPRAFQAHLQPVIAGRSIVSQQRRRLILIHDQNIHITVVVKIAKGASPTDMSRRNSGAGLFAELHKLPVSLIAKHEAWPAPRKLGVNRFQFRIHGSSNQQNVRESVVVQIDQAGAPTNEAALAGHAGVRGDVVKLPLPKLWYSPVACFLKWVFTMSSCPSRS